MAVAGVESKARLAALRCLAELPTRISFPKLFPHRNGVIKCLVCALDDKKRAVRLQAVAVRNQWILVK
jgi:hypothetical protein